jgi:Zn-finger nucleic acid-binding protein
MHCPKCKTIDLKPTKLDDSLPVFGCPECGGSLLSLLYYRDWAERVTLDSANTEYSREVVEDADSKTSLSCPKCSRIMTKYSISGSINSRLDLCGNCDEAWLDDGEWQLLKSLEIANRLPNIFTEQWQHKVRSEKMELSKIERLKKIIGEMDSEKAVEIKKWLNDHANKSTIIQFLGSE